ncbi:MAG: DUF4340 domain-containing protein [Eubacteriales bacterium]|nr:DUF4340 domain-containing protein [Eubacteriales bacterium]
MEHPEKKAPRGERRMSRRALALLLTGAAVALAGALVALLPLLQQAAPHQAAQVVEESPAQTLRQGSASALSEMEVAHADGESYTLVYRDEKLYLMTDEATATLIVESYIEPLVSAATTIAVEDTIAEHADEVSGELANMGLEPPRIAVTVRYAGGREEKIELGVQAPGTTNRYCRWSGDDGVYLCDASLYELFEYTAPMLLPLEQPSFTARLIDQATFTPAGQPPLTLSFAYDADGNRSASLLSPVVYPADSEASGALLTALENFRLGTRQAEVTNENRAEYGFDAPLMVIDIHQQEGVFGHVDDDGVLQTTPQAAMDTRLTFGRAEGDAFYTCEYQGSYYYVSRILCATLLAARQEGLVSRAPASLGDVWLSRISAQTETGLMELTLTRTEQVEPNGDLTTDENGDVVYDVAVTVNGESAAEEAYASLVTRLSQMTASGNAEGAPQGEPRWRLTLTALDGRTRELCGYSRDLFTDVVTVDGVALHTFSSEALRIALGEWYPE